METDDEELANISFDCFSKVVALSELNDDVVLLTVCNIIDVLMVLSSLLLSCDKLLHVYV